jgi:hypothetical protein
LVASVKIGFSLFFLFQKMAPKKGPAPKASGKKNNTWFVIGGVLVGFSIWLAFTTVGPGQVPPGANAILERAGRLHQNGQTQKAVDVSTVIILFIMILLLSFVE